MALTDHGAGSSPRRARRAGVVGSPVAHSLSPVLHEAAYAALGLSGWSYERIECDAEGLAGLLRELGPEWAGLSVTMPGKHAAMSLAAGASARAKAVGVANTLVHNGAGEWTADCTDIDGITGALRCAAGFTAAGFTPGSGAATEHSGLLLGAGGTAAAALAGFAELGVRSVTLAVREPARANGTVETAQRLGLPIRVCRMDSLDVAAVAADADVVVSTLPAGAIDHHAEALARSRCLLDVVYHPWPTPLALAVERAGGRLATGLDMLLHQSFGQVEQFTGQPAPRERMRAALQAVTGAHLPL